MDDSRVVTLKIAVNRKKGKTRLLSVSLCVRRQSRSGTLNFSLGHVEFKTLDEHYDVVRNKNNENFSSER